MLVGQVEGLRFYQFPHFEAYPELQHAVFTRQGGASQGVFRSLNTAFNVGDDPQAVRLNCAKIAAFMGGKVFFVNQVHGVETLVLEKSSQPDQPSCDAVITTGPELVGIRTADCQPILFYDPVMRVVANIHAGWRGSIQNIIKTVVTKMEAVFGTRAGDILAGIGPSLGPCCAEFINFRREIPSEYHHYRHKGNFFDFWAISQDQMAVAGLAAENIICSQICTACRSDLFYSYRNENITGRFASVIGLRS